MSRADLIEQQAAEWLVREDGDGWSFGDAIARDAWLSEAPEHRVAWLRLKSVWSRADRLAVLHCPAVPAARPSRTVRYLAAIAATFILCALGVSVWWAVGQREGETFHTIVGANETVHLADGTLLELNTDTEVHALVTRDQRRVILDRGEAFFAVAHDSKRPFVVLAGNKRITDIGTKFSVRRDGDNVQVIVTEGRVRIDDVERPHIVPAVMAKADIQVVASAESTLVAERTPQQLARALSWRSGILIFNHETLADIAGEFNRYNRKKLVITDASISETRIGGSFQATNVEAFARLLREGFGFKVEETDDSLKVSQ